MISAPQEHNKRLKASHTIIRCDWLFLLCELYTDAFMIDVVEAVSTQSCPVLPSSASWPRWLLRVRVAL